MLLENAIDRLQVGEVLFPEPLDFNLELLHVFLASFDAKSELSPEGLLILAE